MTAEERRFPNEVFALIIDYVYDDPASLRNVALVCKDFAVMSQSHIFHTVCLVKRKHISHTDLFKRFASLLSDTKQTSSVGKFVKDLDLYMIEDFSMKCQDALVSILQNLPSLNEIRLQVLDFIEQIHTGFGPRLVELRLTGISLESLKDLEYLQSMLSSSSGLKILAMYDCHTWGSDLAKESPFMIILPSSLKIASFGSVDPELLHIIALGMSSQSPDLDYLILDDSCEFDAEIYTMIWRSVGTRTRVILYVCGGFFVEPYPDNMIDCTAELKTTEITLLCSEHQSTAAFFPRFISGLPPTVRRICIDFSALVHDELGGANSWSEFDAALIGRHEMGLLERVLFTCTVRTDTLGFRLRSWKEARAQRSILDRLETLLPRSKDRGFIEVDRRKMYLQVSDSVCSVCDPSALRVL
ncbi:hypothetical protein GYMLUDRAFT_74418 [Collybiopsis luxurians FD-317 M1]|uniref:F-box domain-containing protein n=1 Tax=Collybiopsis luxurians FD-317 M1 TaxID=944289 RepID=A0A0D0CLT1_9AGAR|nr:hypothetical protein GYMLUDRAFT_74418 [Collybiopsis luxurians FD-317 M1]